jgi:hypothetical protein
LEEILIITTKIHEDWFKHSEVNKGDMETHTERIETSYGLLEESRLKSKYEIVTKTLLKPAFSIFCKKLSTP